MPRFVTYFIILFVLSFSVIVVASSSGKIGRTNLSSTPGCTCHGSSPSTAVQVLIEGPDTVEINSSTTFLVRISGGPAAAAGTNIAASDGLLNPTDGSLKLDSGELTHTSPLSFGSNNDVTFSFTYTAPATEGAITLAANGNSVNLNGGTSGDMWNFAPNKVVTIETPNAIGDELQRVPDAFVLHQNYPNPFNPTTVISYQLSVGSNVKLVLYNTLGEKVVTLVNKYQAAGGHSVTFNGANLPSGLYIYTLQAGSQQESRRMILSK